MVSERKNRPAEKGQSSFKITSNRVWLDKIRQIAAQRHGSYTAEKNRGLVTAAQRHGTYRRRLIAGLLVEGVLDVGKDNVALGALAGRETETVRVALEHAGVLATDENLWAWAVARQTQMRKRMRIQMRYTSAVGLRFVQLRHRSALFRNIGRLRTHLPSHHTYT